MNNFFLTVCIQGFALHLRQLDFFHLIFREPYCGLVLDPWRQLEETTVFHLP